MLYLIVHIASAIAAIHFATSGPKAGRATVGLMFAAILFGPLAALLFWVLRAEEIRKHKELTKGD